MGPATNPTGMREGADNTSNHHAPMRFEAGEEATMSSNDYLYQGFNPAIENNPDRYREEPQPSGSGLRHNAAPDGTSVNMTTTYQIIQAYRPPAYVSPYGAPQSSRSETTEVNIQSIRQSNAPRLPSKGDPPWICCFAQKKIPEWKRHKAVSNIALLNTGANAD